ncbi:MAG: hypothetical protein H6937_11150 [Burkholderiales bacterium]|nr:hypothetical protein [Burkholderiales bacterium]MDR4516363.1 hypothetical protein [Nitrosomonas sp.]
MSIFHGVPLNTLKDGYWHKWKNWIYEPSIPAARCEHCKIVLLSYDNDAQESPKKEILACRIFSLIFIVAATAILGIMLLTYCFFMKIPLIISATGGIVSLLILLLGIILLGHATDKHRMNSL